MKKIVLLVLCLTFLCFSLEGAASEPIRREESLSAKIVEFPININYERYNTGEDTSNKMLYCSYPIILYNDIAYIPLTYYNCSLMGLNTEIKENKVFVRKEIPENPALYLRDQTAEERSESSIYVNISPFDVNIQGIDYKDADYPALFYNDIVYLPLTWKVVNDIMHWDYTFGENGIELYTEAYYYYSTGDSRYELKVGGGVNAATAYGKTYWSNNGVKVYAEITHDTVGGPRAENMIISKGANVITVPGFTTYGQKMGPLFLTDGEYIYTVHSDGTKYGACKISIDTGEIIYTDGEN